MSVKGLEMLRKHMSYYDFDPDRVLLLGNVLYYSEQAESEVAEMESENKKLHERVETLGWLLKLALKYAEEGELDRYELCDLCSRLGTCENHPAVSCIRTDDTSSGFIRDCMRELGIEVTE